MERGLPSPAMRLFGRETCVVMPSFVQEIVRTIRQIALGQRGDRIDHLPKSGFRVPPKFRLVKGIHQISSRLRLAAHIGALRISCYEWSKMLIVGTLRTRCRLCHGGISLGV